VVCPTSENEPRAAGSLDAPARGGTPSKKKKEKENRAAMARNRLVPPFCLINGIKGINPLINRLIISLI
jgi:hypothetical protein